MSITKGEKVGFLVISQMWFADVGVLVFFLCLSGIQTCFGGECEFDDLRGSRRR
jgi:hypothetical protein